MSNVVFLLACLLAGAGLRRWRLLDAGAAPVINQVLLRLCLPALTLLYTADLRFESRYALPVLMPWVVFGGSWAFFRVMQTRLGLTDQSRVALTLTAGIPSVSFVGFPIFEWLYGAEGLKTGVLMSQAGSFLVCGTVGVLLASYHAPTASGRKLSLWQLLLNVLRFPTFGAFVVALVINAIGWHWPPVVRAVLERVGSPFSFLALLSVGLPLWWGLGYKLLLAPALVVLLTVGLLHRRDMTADISILGAGLGPMNTVAVIAANYGLDPPLVARMVGIGIPLSLFTVALIYIFLTL
jgi:malate permease and related proteins